MELNFENMEVICRICLQCKQSNDSQLQNEMDNSLSDYEYSSIYSSITIDSRTISLIDIISLCLSHKVNKQRLQRLLNRNRIVVK